MPKKNRGMTLIEILVAFVVLSMTLAVIMRIFSGGLHNAAMADSYSRALFLAESKLAATGIERPLVPGEESGRLGSDLYWRVTVSSNTADDDAGMLMMSVRLYQVKVVVGWKENNREKRIELTTLRLGPKQ